MKDYVTLKQKAIKLRKKGLSYGEIKKEINVGKSTLSFWLKYIKLNEKFKKKLYTKSIQNLSKGTASQKERRKKEIDIITIEAKKEVKKPLSRQTILLMGAALYWAEGSKTRMFEITNSDPYLVLFMIRWIELIFEVKAKTLKAKLNFYSQQNEIELKKFWSDLTGIPLENFTKGYIKPKNKGYKKNNLYYGTIRIMIPKSTDRRHRLFGWIEKALEEIDPKVKKTKIKWGKLREVKRPVNL